MGVVVVGWRRGSDLHAFGWSLLLLLLCFGLMVGRATTAAKTEPSEVAALNAILGRWGKPASSKWNLSGEPCSGSATDSTEFRDPSFNPAIKCDCSYNGGNTCHITQLRVYALDVTGPIPQELQNLTYLWDLDIRQNYLTGSVPAFLGNLTAMKYLSVGTNALSGPIPKELGKLQNLLSLGLGTNNYSGSLPLEFGNFTNLEQLYIPSSGIGGELPSTLAKLKRLEILWASDNNFTGTIPDYIGSWTNMTVLRFQGNSFRGPIPSSLSNLTKLIDLRIGDIMNGSSSLAFISNMTSLSTLILRNNKISDSLPSNFDKLVNLLKLDLSFNNITGKLPQSLFNLNSLSYLFLGNNSLSGELPAQKSTSLLNIDLSYNQLSGSFPSWVNQTNLELNLVANNFVVDDSNNSNLPSGLSCLQRDIPCYRGDPIYYSFAVKCGGNKKITASDGIVYEVDDAAIGAASYYVTDTPRWGVSNVGSFADASNASYIINSASQFENTLTSELFQTARMSPSSLRYYGIGLQNGNYTIVLQFAEIAYPDPPQWQSAGRRVFDIYIQGDLIAKDVDIRKEAGGVSLKAVVKNFTAPVTNNFLEIHFFWAGKGTCCVPTQGYYGPFISAISVSPYDFTPTVSNEPPSTRSKSKAGLIGGIVAGVVALGLLMAFGIFFWRRGKRRLGKDDEDLLGIVGRPDIFSYAELRSATEGFSSKNILGEGGFGAVYKGKLPDGRVVAVKQLSVTSHQGKHQFLAEIATISKVQQRNLVKLYGCCIEGNKPLLVYEYLENKSLDLAIFGKGSLYLEWPDRFEICLGIARGLAYLHEESSVRIVHRDIKASNILIDANLTPKISDFGLAKLYDDNETHISTRVAGTIGYLAPEYAMRGHLTEKADVFAFGVLILEIVAGRRNADSTLALDKIYLLEWAWHLYENQRVLELVDPNLTSFNDEEAARVIGVAFLCTQGSPLPRPSMSRVIAMLMGDIEVNEVSTKPSYLTEWQFKEMSSAFLTGNSSQSPMPSSLTGQVDESSSSSSAVPTEATPTPSQHLSSTVRSF